MRKMLFVYNPRSGKGLIRNNLFDIINTFTQGGYEVTAYPTQALMDGYKKIQTSAQDYDMVVVDELSSFKNHQSKRFRAMMKVRPKVGRIVGLTGTPSSNGLMDLWAEFKLLDMGQRLGRLDQRFCLLDEYSEKDDRRRAGYYGRRVF